MHKRLYYTAHVSLNTPPPVTAFSLMNKGPSYQFLAYEQQAGSIIFECRVQVLGNRYPGVETYKQHGNIVVILQLGTNK